MKGSRYCANMDTDTDTVTDDDIDIDKYIYILRRSLYCREVSVIMTLLLLSLRFHTHAYPQGYNSSEQSAL